MSDLKRFDIVANYNNNGDYKGTKIDVCEEGDYVKYSEAADLIDQQQREIEGQRAHISTMVQAIQSNCYDDPSQAGQRLMALAEQSPQTSLAEVRASAVEDAIESARKNYDYVNDAYTHFQWFANKIRNRKDGE